MGCITVFLIGSKDAGVLQPLFQVLALAASLEQQHQSVAGDAAFVGLYLIWAIGLRAAVRMQRKLISLAGRARERRILAGFRRERFLYQILAHRTCRLQKPRILLAAQFMEFEVGENAHPILCRRNRVGAIGDRGPAAIQKSCQDKAGIPMVRRTLLVEFHLSVQGLVPRRPGP